MINPARFRFPEPAEGERRLFLEILAPQAYETGA